MTDSSPGLLQGEMQDLERELEELINEWADAERSFIARSGQVERLKAVERLKLKKSPPAGIQKPTREDLDALVLDWLWTEHGELMEAQLEAEALCAAFKAKFKCAEPALSSKQTRLNADLKLTTNTHR